jgi:hypothetical protein
MSTVLPYDNPPDLCLIRRTVRMPGPLPQYPITRTPEQAARLQSRSPWDPAPYAEVPRARLRLLAHHHPAWRHSDIARQVGCTPETVRQWRRRWQTTAVVRDAPRAGARRTCTPLQRAQITALAWSAPQEHGKAWRRWAGEKRAQVAGEQQMVQRSAPGTIRPWRRQEKSKPWRYHAWQHATDPQCVAQAAPGLDRYEHAQALAAQGEAVVCRDAKTSLQARQRVSATKAAAPGFPLHVADR